LRETEFVPPKCKGSIINSNGLPAEEIVINSVTNTHDYSTAFKYSNYQWDPSRATVDMSNIGICDTSNVLKFIPLSYDILFKDATYLNGGEYWNTNSSPVSATTLFTPTPKPKQKSTIEGMTASTPSVKLEYQKPAPSMVTDAMKDTASNIRAGLYNQQQLAKMMEAVNINYNNLTYEKIPKYEETKTILESNPNYDYNGKTLMYFNSQPVPNVDEQRAIDSNQGVNNQTSLYLLGTLTAATLLVMALILGRD
jgi:hypothetical protein